MYTPFGWWRNQAPISCHRPTRGTSWSPRPPATSMSSSPDVTEYHVDRTLLSVLSLDEIAISDLAGGGQLPAAPPLPKPGNPESQHRARGVERALQSIRKIVPRPPDCAA